MSQLLGSQPELSENPLPALVKRKEVLGVRDEDARERWKSRKRKRERLKDAYINVKRDPRTIWKKERERDDVKRIPSEGRKRF